LTSLQLQHAGSSHIFLSYLFQAQARPHAPTLRRIGRALSTPDARRDPPGIGPLDDFSRAIRCAHSMPPAEYRRFARVVKESAL
jgi:hypothetical protein